MEAIFKVLLCGNVEVDFECFDSLRSGDLEVGIIGLSALERSVADGFSDMILLPVLNGLVYNTMPGMLTSSSTLAIIAIRRIFPKLWCRANSYSELLQEFVSTFPMTLAEKGEYARFVQCTLELDPTRVLAGVLWQGIPDMKQTIVDGSMLMESESAANAFSVFYPNSGLLEKVGGGELVIAYPPSGRFEWNRFKDLYVVRNQNLTLGNLLASTAKYQWLVGDPNYSKAAIVRYILGSQYAGFSLTLAKIEQLLKAECNSGTTLLNITQLDDIRSILGDRDNGDYGKFTSYLEKLRVYVTICYCLSTFYWRNGKVRVCGKERSQQFSLLSPK